MVNLPIRRRRSVGHVADDEGFAQDLGVRVDSETRQPWIRKHAAKQGWSVNLTMVYNLRLALDCEEMYGRRYCPCFEPSGEPDLDRQLICPCEFAQAEIDSTGWCHCTLFGRGDLSPADYKRAESCLMGEYRDVPLKWADGELDTRGMPIDDLRGLPIPDAVHQVKRALNGKGTPLRILVATRARPAHRPARRDARPVLLGKRD
jgi:ferredoxin-thioredoxin reductase catalytic subunit